MKNIPIARSRPSSNACERLEFCLPVRGRALWLLLPLAIALALAAASLGSLPWWQRGLLGAGLLAPASCGARRLLPGRHAAAVSTLSIDCPRACRPLLELRVRLRDGVERRASVCRSSLLLPAVLWLVCEFDRGGAALGPGQRLPRRVYALLLARDCQPQAWRKLLWLLRRPVRTAPRS